MSDPMVILGVLTQRATVASRWRNAAGPGAAIVAVAVVLAGAYLHGPFTGSSAPANDPAVTAAPAPATGVRPPTPEETTGQRGPKAQ
jgi:hypothetical protein